MKAGFITSTRTTTSTCLAELNIYVLARQCCKYDVCEPVVRQCHPERVISCPWIRKQQLLSKQSANSQFRNLWNCQNVFPWIIVLRQFPSSELPETKKSRSEADYGGGSAIKLWLLQRISSISSTRQKMDIIFFVIFVLLNETQQNHYLFGLFKSFCVSKFVFLQFRDVFEFSVKSLYFRYYLET